MAELNKYINMIGMKNLVLIGIGIFVLILLFFVYRSFRLKKYRKAIVEVENHMNAVKSMPLQYRLGRVQSISKNMPDVVEQYEQYSKEYEAISDFQKNELAVFVNEVDEQLFYGKLKKISKKMSQLNEMVDRYEKDSQALLEKIEKITEIENVRRVQIIKVKERYRQLLDNYEKMRYKVEQFVPGIQKIFNEVDDSFVELETLMNHQQFEDAHTFTDSIREKVEWIEEQLKNLPDYIAVVRQYLPKKLDAVHAMVESMPDDIYALNQLEVPSRIQLVETTLEDSVQHISRLELDDMGDILATLAESLDKLYADLENEKKSYNEFKEKWTACYELITSIYDEYKQSLIDYNRIHSLYMIDNDVDLEEHYEEFDEILRESYELEEEMKSSEFAYTQMNVKIDSMHQRASVHQEYLDAFAKFRNELDLQEQRAIDELENINIVLLEIKSEIKNKHLPMINESYKDYIQDSYDKAAHIQAYRMNRPVDLSVLSEKVNDARDVIYKLYDNVHNLIVTAEMVEEAIVFGNRYRSTFLEVNTELTKAEVLFRNGEYTKALSTAVDIIEKIQPGSYEKLIKKSNEKSI